MVLLGQPKGPAREDAKDGVVKLKEAASLLHLSHASKLVFNDLQL